MRNECCDGLNHAARSDQIMQVSRLGCVEKFVRRPKRKNLIFNTLVYF